MQKDKIIFWVATGIIFAFEGVMPALYSQTELSKASIAHLQYPQYFGNALVVCKILGVLALVIPQIPKRLKEWAYAGFTINFIFAAISHGMIDGFDNPQTYFPFVILAILAVSYNYHHKLNADKSW